MPDLPADPWGRVMPDAPDLLAAFEDYCEKLADEAERALEANRRNVALCGIPWPVTLRDDVPVKCQLAEGHDGTHWHWTGGIDVQWGGKPYSLIDE